MKVKASVWLLFLLMSILGSTRGAEFQVVQEGFEAFSQGTFEHAGQDIYVSRKGRIQLIRRWDLNNDGYYDLPFASTHNVMVGSVDALGYLQTNRGYRSVLSPLHRSLALYDLWRQEEKSRSSTLRLPADRPSAVVFNDVDQDGYPDIVFASSGLGDTPFSDSLIYWGNEFGYQRESRSTLPTVGAGDVAVGDLNQDGRKDVVFANRGGGGGRLAVGSYIYWGSTDFYGERHRSTVPTVAAIGCRIADLDEDGRLDLVFATAGKDGGLELYWGSDKGPDLKSPERFPIPDLESLEVGRIEDRATVAALSGDKLRLLEFQSRKPIVRKTLSRGGKRVRLEDLDKDGRVEIILASGEASAIIWGKDGSTTSLPTLGARDVAVADLNGDGSPELIFANYSEGSYGDLDVNSYVYWGGVHGYGEHSRSDLQTFGAAAVAVGDLNRDGRQDLLFGNTGSGISGGKDEFVYVYWGRPHRGYSPAFVSRYPCVMAMGVAMVDLDDDDDHAELLVANSGRHYSGLPGASYLYWGTPNGPAVEKRLDFDLNETGSWEIGDLNRDGYLDVVAFDFDTLLIAWGSRQKYADPSEHVLIKGVANLGQNCRLLDINRDGWLDILVADIRGPYSKILLGGEEGYSTDRIQRLEEANLGNVEVADLDADGWLDLVLLRPYTVENGVDRGNSWIKIYHGDDQGLESGPRFEFPTVGAIDVVVADLNGDGSLDLAVSQYESRSHRKLPVLVFWNGGRGGFSAQRRTDLPGESPSALLAADLDYDGHNDLLVVNHKLTVGEDNHSVESYLYWGGEEGFSTKNRTYLPAPGPHFLQNVDVGNLGTRKPEASFTSPALDFSSSPEKLTLSYEGETPRESRIRFLVRSASSREGLDGVVWKPLSDSGRFTRAEGDSWLQYRTTLIAGRGYSSPYLTGVTIRSD